MIDAVTECYSTYYSNVHRGKSTLGLQVSEALEASREKVRAFLNAASVDEIIFTAGTTLAINLLALATPLFAMTVYNKVIGQRALATLDVLAVGMLVVILFETSLRTLRGYVSAHTAARLDAYLGGEVLHHMLALPYKQFETTTTGILSERLHQLEVLRNFFAGQLPLLIVDLAFVALFLGVLAYIHPVMLAATLGAEQHVILPLDLRQLGGSALTADIAVPKQGVGEDIPVTYVPARNLVFLSLTLAWAEALSARDIFIGVNALDYSGYPDCRPEFIAGFANLAELATKAGAEGNSFAIHAPLELLGKAEIAREALRLGLDPAMSWSCYDPQADGRPCGLCDSCRLRRAGFSAAGLEDGLDYAAG